MQYVSNKNSTHFVSKKNKLCCWSKLGLQFWKPKFKTPQLTYTWSMPICNPYVLCILTINGFFNKNIAY